MAKKKKLLSGFELIGIAPNILLKEIEKTAPFIFQGELDTTGDMRAFLEKLRFYKKNLKALAHINLTEYFHICLCAHWSTAGTYVPTDVDNQIRKGLWEHKSIKKHIEKMAKLTIESWKWDYEQVTNRKSYNRIDNGVMSTHEGTWLSVAIGAYCALVKNDLPELAKEVEDVIVAECRKEEALMLQLKKDQDHINFLRAAPLIAHNFGDLDRVIEAWDMTEERLCKSIYKLGHIINPKFDPIIVYTGTVNKEFSSKENHRHMAMRQPKCIRKSHKFLIPVGPFMDDWGIALGSSSILSPVEKAEIIAAMYDGWNRQEQAFGYARGFGAMMRSLSPEDLNEVEANIAFDLLHEINKSEFKKLADKPIEEFEAGYIKGLNEFICPKTGLTFN
jgi:hypothetical protein